MHLGAAEHDLIDATEVLPIHGATAARTVQPAKHEVCQTDEESVSTPIAAVLTRAGRGSSNAPYLRWLAFGSGAAALILLIAVLFLIGQMIRDGKSAEITEPFSDERTAGPQQTQANQPVERDAGNSHGREDNPPEAAVMVVEPDQLEPPPPPEIEVAPPTTQPVVEPPTTTTKKPKPKPKSSVGVLFFVESKLDGQLEVGRRTVTIQNRAGWLELPPGNYNIRWRAKGSSDWVALGKLRIKDIAPKRYEVRIDGVKVVKVKEVESQ